MKNLGVIASAIALLFVFQSCGTRATSSIEPITKVVPVENTNKNDLYVRANNWMVSAFKNAESVVQFSDKESGTVTGKYYLSPITAANQYGPAQDAYAIINIQVKDEAGKITVTPEKFDYMKGNMYTLYNEESAKQKIENLITSFETAMLKPENKDW
ncbi:DUF4468 domain-containing protein [Christiangramia echinicola]|uniref:DUF4468 domain-containing protein n=1 Tax=Christiangramia echinicola TaxID=279359 RepID=UPI00047AFDC1|nr:DUF4468 domain-containing protein [Christiangramia echinicola]